MEDKGVDSLGFLLAEIIRLHHARTFNLFAQLGLYRGQPPILFVLWKEGGKTQKEIADALRLKPSTITVTLKRMEKAGLLERRSDPQDLRISRVYLTEKGYNLQMEVEKALKAFDDECFKGFTLEEKVLLRRFFIQIRDNLIRANGGGC